MTCPGLIHVIHDMKCRMAAEGLLAYSAFLRFPFKKTRRLKKGMDSEAWLGLGIQYYSLWKFFEDFGILRNKLIRNRYRGKE